MHIDVMMVTYHGWSEHILYFNNTDKFQYDDYVEARLQVLEK
jgi:hypothetical protein